MSLLPQTRFEWKAELGSAFNTAYNAQLGRVTYYVTSRDYGHPAYLEVRDPRGGLKRLDLGNYHKIEQAKQACERHYAAVATWVGRRTLAAKRSTFGAGIRYDERFGPGSTAFSRTSHIACPKNVIDEAIL